MSSSLIKWRKSWSDLRALLTNSSWLVLEKLVNVASAFIVGVWVVRTIGPHDFGQLSVAAAVVAVLTSLATAGIETVLLRALAAKSDLVGDVLRAAIQIRLVGAFIHVGACFVVALVFYPDDYQVMLLTLIIALGAILRVADVSGAWLQDRGEYARYSGLRIATRILSDLYRVYLIYSEGSVYLFAAAQIVESMLLALLFSTQFTRINWRTNGNVASIRRVFLVQAVPVAVAGMLAALYSRVDQFLIYRMLGAESNGIYAAATRISEAFTMLVVSIGVVAASRFGRLAAADQTLFLKHFIRYNRMMLAAGFLASLAVSWGSPWIVVSLYGEKFVDAAPILAVHAWTIWLVFASTAMEPWFYQHGKLGMYVPKTLLALFFCIPTTWLLTDYFGLPGTAAAVVLTYMFSVYASNFLLPGLRGAIELQWRIFGLNRR